MGKKLYVGNLPFSVTEDSLKEMFAQFGTVESVNIITDRYTGQPKGFGFIELSTKQEAAAAIGKMNNAELDGRNLKVSEALPQTPRGSSGSPRGNYGGGFRR